MQQQPTNQPQHGRPGASPERLAQIRRQLAAGTYYNEEAYRVALDRMVRQVAQETHGQN